jgi:hypothetical protein
MAGIRIIKVEPLCEKCKNFHEIGAECLKTPFKEF